MAASTTAISIEHVPIGKVRPDSGNPRRIKDAEMEALTRSVHEFGLVDPIIARRSDGLVIGGHQRLVAARRLGYKTVPVVFIESSDEHAKLLSLALNRISGDWDRELLARLMGELASVPAIDISLTGFDEDEIARLLKTIDARERRHREETFDLDAAWAQAKGDPGVQRGDIWRLGDHRIMCGDSTAEADVARLVAGGAATLMVTDPPYGVDYDTSWRTRRGRRPGRPITNDDLGEDQAAFWRSAFGNWPLNGDAYAFSPSGPLIATLCSAIQAAGIEHHQWLIWVK